MPGEPRETRPVHPVRRRTFAPGLVLAGALVASACGEDTLVRGRADTGVAAPDGGASEPLPYRVGMSFTYRATLTHRTSTREEKSAAYTVTYRVTAVDDRGAAAASTLTVTATGAQTFRQNWDLTAGADSWVALAGPADDTDRVGAAAKTITLSAPARPPFPKSLPAATPFFLDLRQAEAVRRAFAEAQAAASPRFVAPTEDPRGRWVLVLDGRDPDASFYAPSQRRLLSLAYDVRGWLVEADETLGDAAPNTPTGRFRLTLERGPE